MATVSPAPHADSPLVIFKLGGSLLSLPGLPGRIAAVLQQRPHHRWLMIVGGGPAADIVRRWYADHELSDEVAHRLALEAMALNTSLVVQLVERSILASDAAEIDDAWTSGLLPVVHPPRFLDAMEGDARPAVPHTWDATSDSIAAWIAATLAAQELVLIKSIDRPDSPWSRATSLAAVDPHFPVLTESVPSISWVNLRRKPATIARWNAPLDHSPVGRGSPR